MRALVVGGAGFIGSTLVDRLLAEGHAVDVVDDLSTGSLANLADARADRSYDFTFHRLDVREAVLTDLVVRRRPDVIFHLALPTDPAGGGAVAPEGPGDGSEAMVLGAQQVVAAARAAGVAKVVVGFDARHRYGRVSADALPVAESFGGRDESRWGDALRVMIALLETARADDALEFTALALATVYGPRQPATAPISELIAAARRIGSDAGADGGSSGSGDLLVASFGPAWAASTDDLLFVDDAVDALVRAAARGSGLVINVGTGIATSGDVLAALVMAATTPPADPRPGAGTTPRPGRDVVVHFALDPARAGMQLGWKPWTSVAEGIATTVAAQAADRS